MLYASPREDSGTHASRYEEALGLDVPEEEDWGGSPLLEGAGFCCIRAIKPGILSLDEGVGCT